MQFMCYYHAKSLVYLIVWANKHLRGPKARPALAIKHGGIKQDGWGRTTP